MELVHIIVGILPVFAVLPLLVIAAIFCYLVYTCIWRGQCLKQKSLDTVS